MRAPVLIAAALAVTAPRIADACQPCAEPVKDEAIIQHSPLLVLVERLREPELRTKPRSGPPIDLPPPEGSHGAYRAKVLRVLKGRLDETIIRVRWSYGMCPYPGPDIAPGAQAILFLAPDQDGAYRPTSAGCGSVFLAVREGRATVDGRSMTLDELARRYGAAVKR